MSERYVFPALLRHWRTRRGFSQLDLSAAAEVSARHISFLETGRARPSREMVLRLSSTLDVPLREQNLLLAAAGFAEAFVQTGLDDGLEPGVARALAHMLDHHEPYPLLIMDRRYELLMTNRSAERLLEIILGPSPTSGATCRNLMKLIFDPDGLRPVIEDWEAVVRFALGRLHRELLSNPTDEGLERLVSALRAYPGVPTEWRTPDLTAPSQAVLPIRLAFRGERLAFLTALTVFNAPQNVTVEELRIESYFPLDELTRLSCARLLGG